MSKYALSEEVLRRIEGLRSPEFQRYWSELGMASRILRMEKESAAKSDRQPSSEPQTSEKLGR
jgi:hypothetical protein